jgi:hypothetical protein
MAIQIDGSAQTAQQQNVLDTMISEAGRFAQQARRVTTQITEFIRVHKASGLGEAIGILKAACSYAVLVGEMDQSEANALLQQAYGNTSETTVPAEDISNLTNQWV